MKIGTAVLAVIAAVMLAFAPQVVFAFQKHDPEVVALGTAALRCQMAVLPLMSYVVLCSMMLQTVGETLRASVVSAARQGLFFIPAILILPAVFQFTGVMLAQPFSDLCAFLIAVPLAIGSLRRMCGQDARPKEIH